ERAYTLGLRAALAAGALNVGKQPGEQSQDGQESADLIDEVDTGKIRQGTERGGSHSAHSEGEPEEQAGDGSGLAREQLLGIHHDRRKRRREDQPDRDRQRRRPEEARMRQKQRERQHAEYGDPDDVFASEPITERSADDRAQCDGGEEQKQQQLRA